jgi:hypothetical protein
MTNTKDTHSFEPQDVITVSVRRIKHTGLTVYFSSNGAIEAGNFRHPQRIMDDLGIVYNEDLPASIDGDWIFHHVTLGGSELPPYMHIYKENESYYEVAK